VEFIPQSYSEIGNVGNESQQKRTSTGLPHCVPRFWIYRISSAPQALVQTPLKSLLPALLGALWHHQHAREPLFSTSNVSVVLARKSKKVPEKCQVISFFFTNQELGLEHQRL